MDAIALWDLNNPISAQWERNHYIGEVYKTDQTTHRRPDKSQERSNHRALGIWGFNLRCWCLLPNRPTYELVFFPGLRDSPRDSDHIILPWIHGGLLSMQVSQSSSGLTREASWVSWTRLHDAHHSQEANFWGIHLRIKSLPTQRYSIRFPWAVLASSPFHPFKAFQISRGQSDDRHSYFRLAA